MDTAAKKVVLYGVLNWGLGHATRSVPVIKALLWEGFEPVIASDGAALEYLRNEFPQLQFETLPSYDIRYGKGANPLLALAAQLPKIFRAQRKENQVLEKLCEKHGPVGVISDNRLGFYHSAVPSVYITHQLKLMLPFARNFGSRFHHMFINKYTECWVPDVEGENNLTGEMGHSLMPRVPVKYVGVLSRFSGVEVPLQKKVYDACAILSGPEPQRSILEGELVSQMGGIAGKFLLVRGTSSKRRVDYPANVEVQDISGGAEIVDAVASSKLVISRSGYSSIMDYRFLKNKALFIPTPAQPEQEYLARYHLHKGRFLYSGQEFLNLKEDLAKAHNYTGFAQEKEVQTDWSELFSLFQRKAKS